VRTKHTEKSCVSLWGQSLISEAVEADCRNLEKSYLLRDMIGEGF